MIRRAARTTDPYRAAVAPCPVIGSERLAAV